MKRIDTATRATNLFGAGRDGFKDGNPLTADPPTTLNASMFNHLQEELARTIEAGGQTLDPERYDQLAGVLGLGTRSHVAGGGYQKLPGGLIVQWGRTVTATSVSTVMLPMPFPTAFFVLVATGGGGTASYPAIGTERVGLDRFKVVAYQTTSGTAYAAPVDWIALGI